MLIPLVVIPLRTERAFATASFALVVLPDLPEEGADVGFAVGVGVDFLLWLSESDGLGVGVGVAVGFLGFLSVFLSGLGVGVAVGVGVGVAFAVTSTIAVTSRPLPASSLDEYVSTYSPAYEKSTFESSTVRVGSLS